MPTRPGFVCGLGRVQAGSFRGGVSRSADDCDRPVRTGRHGSVDAHRTRAAWDLGTATAARSSALLARAVESAEAMPPPGRLARVTMELTRPVPVGRHA